jgi:hypothetical protein
MFSQRNLRCEVFRYDDLLLYHCSKIEWKTKNKKPP